MCEDVPLLETGPGSRSSSDSLKRFFRHCEKTLPRKIWGPSQEDCRHAFVGRTSHPPSRGIGDSAATSRYHCCAPSRWTGNTRLRLHSSAVFAIEHGHSSWNLPWNAKVCVHYIQHELRNSSSSMSPRTVASWQYSNRSQVSPGPRSSSSL